MNDIGML